MGKRKKRDGKWWPLQKRNPDTDPARGFMEHMVPHPDEVWENDRYVVAVRRDLKPGPQSPPLVHLSIRRKDWKPVTDYRHKQRIKNEIVGEGYEAVELYPREERLVDNANVAHLWVVDDADWPFPFGFNMRIITEGDTNWVKQRPFSERPKDCQQNEKIQAEAVNADAQLAREAAPPDDKRGVRGI